MPTTSRNDETEIDREVSRALGLGTKLIRALESAGATRAELNALAESDKILGGTLEVLRENRSFTHPHNLVDMDGPPRLRWQYSYDPRDQPSNRLHGCFDLSKTDRIDLVTTVQQRQDCSSSYDLRNELANEIVLGAVALEYYLTHQRLVPVTWRNFRIFFWGTILRGHEQEPLVQYMYWEKEWKHGVVTAVDSRTGGDTTFTHRAAVYVPPSHSL